MVEVSTEQRGSNFLLEEGAYFEPSSYMGGRNSTPVVPFDGLVNKTQFFATSADDNSRILRGAGIPQLGLSESLPTVGPTIITWGQIPDADSPVARGHLGGSDYRIYWHGSYSLMGQDSSMPEALDTHGAEGSGILTMTFEDVESAIARRYAALVTYLRGRERASIETVVADKRRDRLAAELWASFEDLPVEDGVGHPAEQIIAKALVQAGEKRAIRWFRDFCGDASSPGFAASVLRCLARVDCAGSVSWRVGLVRDGLAMDSVEIRDAAIQAAESWCDSEMLEVLRAHSEPEPWLRQYLYDVIDDLSE